MTALRAIEEWTGHRQPPNPMKATFFILLAVILTFFALGMSGCITKTTRTITTDKEGTVTDTTLVEKGSDPAALELMTVFAEMYLPRKSILIKEQKSLHSTEPIHPFETAFRWHPTAN